MASGQWAVVLRQVQRVFQVGSVAGLSEGQLLDRFVSRKDDLAFEAIVARHGPMVLGVCRSVLRDPHDVDDAFQATFLVLVKKAQAVQDRDQLGPWLHGVARRVALRSRSDASKRRSRETSKPDSDIATDSNLDPDLWELQSIVRDEVDRLSNHERTAVVTCYLEGLTHEEAADRLGWPVGTVKGRLARARDRLRGRLARRGIILPAGAVASTLSQGASASVPLGLIASTTLAASRLAAGQTLMAGIVSAHCVNLVQGVVGTMSLSKWKLGILVIVAGSVTTPAVLAWQYGGMGGISPDQFNAQAKAKAKALDRQKAQAGGVEAKSSDGSTETKVIPPGSAEEFRVLNQKLSQKAEGILEALPKAEGYEGLPSIATDWSERLLEDRIEGKTSLDPVDRLITCQAHLDSVKRDFAAYKKDREADATSKTPFDELDIQLYMLDFEYRVNEAQRWLAEAKEALRKPTPAEDALAQQPPQVLQQPSEEEPEPTPAEKERNKAILAKLEMVIPMKFETPTPLQDVLKYIKDSTKGPDSKVIPIYVNPFAFERWGINMKSPIVMDLEEIPLKTTLRLILSQLGLTYEVKDGLLMIALPPQNINGFGGGMGGGMGGVGGGFR